MCGHFLRFTNATILALIVLLTLTGLYGLSFPQPVWMYELHRGAGWALIALIPFKAVISWRSLRRGLDGRFDRNVMIAVSLLLAALTFTVLIFSVMWAWRIGPDLVWVGNYGDAVISWHWMLGLGLLIPFALHVWRRWPRPKAADFTGRRQALKLLSLGAAGVVGWWAAEALARTRALPEAPRSPSGSREEGSFTGNAMPITQSVGQGQIVIDPKTWRLTVGGAGVSPIALTYAEVLALPSAELTATLDCTSGWYSTQTWRGVWLTDVLRLANVGSSQVAVLLKDVSGYAMVFTPEEAREIMLATHVGGEVLVHWHGFPLRAVAPSRRGWHWVKWLTEIDVLGNA